MEIIIFKDFQPEQPYFSMWNETPLQYLLNRSKSSRDTSKKTARMDSSQNSASSRAFLEFKNQFLAIFFSILRVNSLLGSHATRCNFGYVTSGASSSETVGSTDLWLVPMAPAQKILFLWVICQVLKMLLQYRS